MTSEKKTTYLPLGTPPCVFLLLRSLGDASSLRSLIFKYRYKTGGSRGVEHFMSENELGYEPIAPSEVDEWQHELRNVFMATHRHLQARFKAV